MENHDVIVYKKKKLAKTLYENFRIHVTKEDMDIARDSFCKFYPEYIDTYDEVLNDREMYAYSLFISSKEWLDDYCEFLFKFLFYLEETLYNANNLKNKRVIGYIAEILLYVYIKHFKFKTKEFYIKFLDAKSSNLANLINDSQIFAYIYYYIYLNQKMID